MNNDEKGTNPPLVTKTNDDVNNLNGVTSNYLDENKKPTVHRLITETTNIHKRCNEILYSLNHLPPNYYQNFYCENKSNRVHRNEESELHGSDSDEEPMYTIDGEYATNDGVCVDCLKIGFSVRGRVGLTCTRCKVGIFHTYPVLWKWCQCNLPYVDHDGLELSCVVCTAIDLDLVCVNE